MCYYYYIVQYDKPQFNTLKSYFKYISHDYCGFLNSTRLNDVNCLCILGLMTAGDGVGSQEDQLCMALVSQLNKFADKETLIQFLRCFLLESNSSSVRWQAHCLALHIYRYKSRKQKREIKVPGLS